MANTRKILYWHGVVGDVYLRAQYSKVLEKLMNGEYAAAKYHKLKDYDVYSVYEDGKDRLIVTTEEIDGKPYLLVLKALPDHDYHNLDKTVLKRYIERNREHIVAQARSEWEEVDEKAIEERFRNIKSAEAAKDLQINFSPADYQQDKCIEYNEKQKDIISAQLWGTKGFRKLLDLQGPAGSGKSLVALVMAENYEEGDVIYLAPTEILARDSEAKFKQMRAGKSPLSHTVEFFSRKEYYMHLHPDLEFADSESDKEQHNKWQFVDEEEFVAWLPGHCESINNWAKQQKIDGVLKTLKKHADLIHQEFFSLGIHTNESSYQNHPDERAIFAKGTWRQLVWKMYIAYKKYLPSKKFIDINLANIELKKQEKLIIIDEAHDLSLHDLCYLPNIFRDCVLISDPHQRTVSCLSMVPDLKEFLKRQDLVPFTLTDPMRYSAPTARVANAAIKFKCKVAGGTPYKGAYIEIPITAEHEKKPGEGIFLTTTEVAELKKMVAELKKKFSILDEIALAIPGHKKIPEHVKEWFDGDLIFTHAKQIKGLGYKVVIMFEPFKEGIFQANRKYRALKQSDKSVVDQAQGINGDIIFNKDINEFFTFLTRNSHTFVICQKVDRNIDELAKLIRAAITSSAPAHSAPSSSVTVVTVALPEAKDKREDIPEDKPDEARSLAEAQKQVHHGNYEIAKNIFKRLGKSEREYIEFEKQHKVQLRHRSPDAPGNIIVASVSALPEHKEHVQATTEIKSAVEHTSPQLAQIEDALYFYKNVNKKNLARLLSHESCIKFLFGYTEKDIKGRHHLFSAIIDEPNKRKMFFEFIKDNKNSEIVEKFKKKLVQSLFQPQIIDASQSQQAEMAPINIIAITDYFESINFLNELFVQNPELVMTLPRELLYKLIRDGESFVSLFYSLARNYEYGMPLLLELLKRNPDLFNAFPRDVLFQLVKDGKNTVSVFYWLAAHADGRIILFEIFKNNPDLYGSCPRDVLYQLVKDGENINSAFYWLSQSYTDGLPLLFLIFSSNPELTKKPLPRDVLYQLVRSDDKIVSTFYWLAAHPEGQKILLNIVKNNTDLIKSLPRKVLYQLVKDGKNTFSAFYHLTSTSNGQALLLKIVMLNPSIVKDISPDVLYRLVRDGANTTSAFNNLSKSDAGRAILAEIEKQNPKGRANLEKWLAEHPEDKAKVQEHIHKYQEIEKQATGFTAEMVEQRYHQIVKEKEEEIRQINNGKLCDYIFSLHETFTENNLRILLRHKSCIKLLFGYVGKQIYGHLNLFYAIINNTEKKKLFIDFINDKKNSEVVSNFYDKLAQELHLSYVIEDQSRSQPFAASVLFHLTIDGSGIDILSNIFNQHPNQHPEWLKNFSQTLCQCFQLPDGDYISALLNLGVSSKGVNIILNMAEQYPELFIDLRKTLFKSFRLKNEKMITILHILIINLPMNQKSAAFVLNIFKQQPELLIPLSSKEMIFQVVTMISGNRYSLFSQLARICPSLLADVIAQSDNITEQNIVDELCRFTDQYRNTALLSLSAESNHITLKAIIKKYPGIVSRLPLTLICETRYDTDGHSYASILFYLCKDSDMEVAYKIADAQPDLLKHLTLQQLCEKFPPYPSQPSIDSLLLVWLRNRKAEPFARKWLLAHPEDKDKYFEHVHEYQRKQYTKDVSLLISKNLMVAQASHNSGQVENIQYKQILELYNHFTNENLCKILASPSCIQLLFGFAERGVNGHAYLFSAIIEHQEKNKLFFDFIRDEKNRDVSINFKKKLIHHLFQVQVIENSLQERQLRMTPFHCLGICLEGLNILASLFRDSSGISTDSLTNALFQLIIKVNEEDFVSIFFIIICMPSAKGVALLQDILSRYPDVFSRMSDTELYRLVKTELMSARDFSTFFLLLNSDLQGKGLAFLSDIYKQHPNLLKALPAVVLFHLIYEANGNVVSAFTRLSSSKTPLLASIIEQNDYITEENIAAELFRYFNKIRQTSFRNLAMEKNHITLKAIIKKFPNIVFQVPHELLCESVTDWAELKFASALFFLCFNDSDMEIACKIVAAQPDLLKHLTLAQLCEKILPALAQPLVDSLVIVWFENKKGRVLLKQWLKEHPEDKGAVEEHIRVYQQKKNESLASVPLVHFSIFAQQDDVKELQGSSVIARYKE